MYYHSIPTMTFTAEDEITPVLEYFRRLSINSEPITGYTEGMGGNVEYKMEISYSNGENFVFYYSPSHYVRVERGTYLLSVPESRDNRFETVVGTILLERYRKSGRPSQTGVLGNRLTSDDVRRQWTWELITQSGETIVIEYPSDMGRTVLNPDLTQETGSSVEVFFIGPGSNVVVWLFYT
jgi:hypothetical protein